MSLRNFSASLYDTIDDFGYSVIRAPVIKSLGISASRSFIVGLIIVLLIISLFIFGISYLSAKSGMYNHPGANRFNIQSSDYSGNIIVADTAFSESKLDESIKGF